MRFYKNKRYLGITYNRLAIHVGIVEARKSGIKEAWTRIGKPFAVCDACEWLELSDNPQEAANQFLKVINGRSFSLTCKIVPELPENAAIRLSEGYELITR